MDIQRLRNLTTKTLHTKIDHVYEDIGILSGVPGVMTHQIPNALRALDPWLRSVVTDQRFWDERLDVTHGGEMEVRSMNESEKDEMLNRFGELPSPLLGKKVIAVVR